MFSITFQKIFSSYVSSFQPCIFPKKYKKLIEVIRNNNSNKKLFMFENQTIQYYSFVFQFKFKSIQPDGLLIYVANSATSFLTDYYAIYLHKGFINVLLMNSNVPKSVISKKTYYDGNWHSVRFCAV